MITITRSLGSVLLAIFCSEGKLCFFFCGKRKGDYTLLMGRVANKHNER